MADPLLPISQLDCRRKSRDVFDWRPAEIYRQRDRSGTCRQRCTLCEKARHQAGGAEYWTRPTRQVRVYPSLYRVLLSSYYSEISRSTGYGSLQVWVKHIRSGVSFQRDYRPTYGCAKQGWRGSAIKIGGGYVWSDVYGLAASNDVVVVGGGTPVS